MHVVKGNGKYPNIQRWHAGGASTSGKAPRKAVHVKRGGKGDGRPLPLGLAGRKAQEGGSLREAGSYHAADRSLSSAAGFSQLSQRGTTARFHLPERTQLYTGTHPQGTGPSPRFNQAKPMMAIPFLCQFLVSK